MKIKMIGEETNRLHGCHYQEIQREVHLNETMSPRTMELSDEVFHLDIHGVFTKVFNSTSLISWEI